MKCDVSFRATMSATPVGGATCPICEEFDGPPSSVEAHISASSGEHEGSYGREYREELEEQAGEGSEMPTPEEYQEQQERLSGSSESTESEPEVDPDPEPEPEPESGSASAGAVGAAGVAALPFVEEVDTKLLVLGVVVVVLAAVLLLSDGSGSGGESAPSGGASAESDGEEVGEPGGVI